MSTPPPLIIIQHYASHQRRGCLVFLPPCPRHSFSGAAVLSFFPPCILALFSALTLGTLLTNDHQRLSNCADVWSFAALPLSTLFSFAAVLSFAPPVPRHSCQVRGCLIISRPVPRHSTRSIGAAVWYYTALSIGILVSCADV